MVSLRRRSVPPPAPPSSDPIQGSREVRGVGSNTITTISSPSPLFSVQPTSAPAPKVPLSSSPSSSSKLISQADALARMTIELNLRAVAAQAERLERDLKTLVQCTVQDKEFRERHDQQLQDMWEEILAVKQNAENYQERSRQDYERCQRDTRELVEQVRMEMAHLRALVDDVGTSLERLPTWADVDSQGDSLQTHTTASTSSAMGSTQPHNYADQSPKVTAIKRRIQEALNSTRRWNRDHKTTSLSDASFTANYLKQQSKRDAKMAVFIQRAIQRRIQRTRRPKNKTRPRNLEQFCQDVTWKDILETVEEALVRDEPKAIQALQ